MPDIYLAKGAGGHLWRLPVPEQGVIVRLSSDDLLIYGPVTASPDLFAEIANLGQPACLVIANRRQLALIEQWQKQWPDMSAYLSKQLMQQAHKMGFVTNGWQILDKELWQDILTSYEVIHSWGGPEQTLFHHPSRSLLISDMIVNLPTMDMPVWTRPFIWLAGIDDSDGFVAQMRWGAIHLVTPT